MGEEIHRVVRAIERLRAIGYSGVDIVVEVLEALIGLRPAADIRSHQVLAVRGDNLVLMRGGVIGKRARRGADAKDRDHRE
jgi:hypothetical protein